MKTKLKDSVDWLTDKQWWRATIWRVVRTMIGTFLAACGGDVIGWLQVDPKAAITMILSTGAISLIMAIYSLPEVNNPATTEDEIK
jgi:hypothetical protein